ncbi:hypothetical protein HB364_30385 [Pseudoflavitalea sp. X16]|uniref:IPT/TIG domain-containing protein n=1 Tax=Paraflavitalea devenefica TaxID=2716334 RepID=UPI001422FE49|nr:IPT/TIG domain-containing protein [Paraflavitalea devenefica]NII29427.1 hypothetical protein [Paraflavitalea devenefica]
MKSILYRSFLLWCIVLLATACKKVNDNEGGADQAPVINSITPDKGPQGTVVTIHGHHFSATAGNNTVKFNDKTATVTTAGNDKLVVTVPKGASTGPVTVTVNGKAATGPVFTYTFGATVTTLAGSTQGFADGTGAAAKFDSPSDVCVDDDGNVYVADRLNQRIRKITPAGVVTTLAGSTLGYVDGVGGAAKFSMPRGLGIGNGGIYVADETNHRIRKVTLGGTVTTIAGSGQVGFGDSTVTEARFYHPYDVCVSRYGSIFVVDEANHRIRKIRNGQVTTLAGKYEGAADGAGAAAGFAYPTGIAVGPNGGPAYIADGYSNGIRKLTFETVIGGVLVDDDTATGIPVTKVMIKTLIESTGGYVDGPINTAQIGLVYNLCVDAAGNVIIADGGNQKVRMITPGGQVTTLAGSTLGYTDGPGASAKFNMSGGIAVDKDGNIYVADTNNHRIRKITLE